MNIFNQEQIRDSHKLTGLSFLELSDLDQGLTILTSDIELGLVSETRAMEVAMYSINYVMARYQDAQDTTERFIENGNNYRASMDSACEQMAIAKNHLQLMKKSFGSYPSIISTVSGLLNMFGYYEAYMIIPCISGIQMERNKNQSISTYFFKNNSNGLIKIGKSVDIKTRKQAIQCGSGSELDILLILSGDIEFELHKKFAKYRKHGEWFQDSDGVITAWISKQLGGAK